jgi:hypothetical protein
MTGEFLTSVLSISGIAAVVAAVVAYILTKVFDAHLKARIDKQLAQLRAENAVNIEYISELVKKQTESYPGLVEAVYKSRNIARKMVERLTEYSFDERSQLGDLALIVTERMYATRVFLPNEAFKQIHNYKTHLQQFVFDYDHLTGGEARPALANSIKAEYKELDRLCDIVVRKLQNVLRIDQSTK